MAFPDDHSRISTNMTPVELEAVIEAVKAKQVKWDKDASGGFAEYSCGEFDWMGQRFKLEEFVEMVNGLYRVEPEKPTAATQSILDFSKGERLATTRKERRRK